MAPEGTISPDAGPPRGRVAPSVRGWRRKDPGLLGEEGGGLLLGVLRPFLGIASVPYGLLLRARARAYRWGILASTRLPRPVISVGNITVGGTGKTPVVETLARILAEGRRVAVLMRGYAGGPGGGDEASLLRESLPDVKVYTGADRVHSGWEALKVGEVDVFLLDDGFQHQRLQRDVDIVTLDALRPFGYGRFLPRGLLREPPTALRRAQVVAITRVNQVPREEVDRIRSRIEKVHPDGIIVEFEMVPSLIREGAGPAIAAESRPLQGEAVLPICGIGNPESFTRSLRALGCEEDPIIFPDHHAYGEEDIAFLMEEADRRGAKAWVTTHKDAGKVRRLSPPAPLWEARVEARPGEGREDLRLVIEKVLWARSATGGAAPGGAPTLAPEIRAAMRKRQRKRARRRRWAGPLGYTLYLAARCGAGLIGIAPLGPALALAKLAGRIAYAVDGSHYRIARENLDHAYGDSLCAAEKDRIILGCYQGLTQNAVEVIHGPRLSRPGGGWPSVEVDGKEVVIEAVSRGKGVILVSGHIGNWELLPGAVRGIGVATLSVATPRRNPWLDSYITRLRVAIGSEIFTKKGAVRGAMEVLREGGALGMLVDQNQRRGGIFVDFFGRKAATVRTAALLSRRTGAPIIPMCDRRLPGVFRHRMRVRKPIQPVRTANAEADILQMTEAYTRQLEEAIREAPEQWLWLHRRWRTRPPEEGKVAEPSRAGR